MFVTSHLRTLTVMFKIQLALYACDGGGGGGECISGYARSNESNTNESFININR